MIVVTGAAGFIGSNLLAALEAHGFGPVAGIDFLETKIKISNVAKRRDVTWVVPSDLMTFLEHAADQISAVIHLGAETATTATDRDKVFAVNLDLSTEIWAWCADHSIPLIYASSASVYGDGTQGFEDSPHMKAMSALKPLNVYGESKLAFDLFVTDQVASRKPTPPQWAGLRFFNVFGPNEAHKGSQASVVSQMHPNAQLGEAYELFRSHRKGIADGEQKRDFIFVDDCIAVIIWLLATPEVSGIYNVGTGHARSFLDLANAVYSATGQPLNINWRDTPESLRAHYQYFTEADTTRLRAAGFDAPFTSLEDGVSITIRDYLSHSDPYR